MRYPLLAASLALFSSAGAAQRLVEAGEVVDRIAARMIPANGPGCTIGVGSDAPATLRAYGAADLERKVPLVPGSILEAGSVSKQFTAAAVALLAIDGKLSFEDDVRRWFPELPDYGVRITVRHLLTHTSGLRDWGSIAGMEGWPRGTRAHTNEDALAIAARQQSLNYPPGIAYSYTNTGYNLLALLVQRASGKSLAQFSRERLFEPLGMKNTSWRDDYERIVPGRALAYTGGRGSFSTDMPNENAYGNGGLLTTVEDLLTWNRAMFDAKLGRPLADSVVKRMVLTNGRTIAYALGLFVNPAARGGGTLEIQHSGSTAGYRAHLIRFPASRLSVAVLCNAGGAINATTIANQIADDLLNVRVQSPGRPDIQPVRGGVSQYAGIWMNDVRRTVVRTTVAGDTLRRAAGLLRFIDPGLFRDGGGTVRFDLSNGRATMIATSADGDTTVFTRVEEWRPDAATLNAFAGSYSTPEVRGEPFVFAIESGQPVLRQGPRTRLALTPVYRDGFAAGGRMVWFTRDAGGRVTEMHLGEDRAWDVVFRRD
jgi:CubicO group peptidase (beta-lactamase class C family)